MAGCLCSKFFNIKYSGIFFFLLVCMMVSKADALRPVPWLTEGAIEFLDDYFKKKPNAKVLEFGSGASTIWFAKKTKNFVSIEHDAKWYRTINSKLKAMGAWQVKYRYIPLPYYEVCDNFENEHFDLIVVDGRDRVKCIEKAIRILKEGGILMLDNSERKRYNRAYELMRKWPLYEEEQKKPDSCGFWYRGWKTSWWIKP